jgi:CRISPR-associated protein Csm4
MQTLTVRIRPRSAFGGPLRGDTLFGQLCWAARHRFGEDRFTDMLFEYTRGQPFLVVSDAFPADYLPRSALPLHRYNDVPDADRKRVKRRVWVPRAVFATPLAGWLAHARTEHEVIDGGLWHEKGQPHNTINRMTGTTGRGEFAPYAMPQIWGGEKLFLDLYICYDMDRIGQEELMLLLRDVGDTGYGRDVSIGLGKFHIDNIDEAPWPSQQQPNVWMTLAPCAPQGLGLDPQWSWYQPFTRFGRHGDLAVHSGRPFKTPGLLADTAALLKPKTWQVQTFFGQGLGGGGKISKAIEGTVQQGYAPVLAVHVEEKA